ncbi:MAG: hypothetical protein AB1489_34590 [Acidobacteriota bacterium]
MTQVVRATIFVALLITAPFLTGSHNIDVVCAQTIDNSPAQSLELFFAAVDKRDYQTARKFIPNTIVKKLEKDLPGGFLAFIDAIAEENAGSRLEITAEKIEDGKALVEAITITATGKRIPEKWLLRLEDNLWKLDIVRPH